MNLTPGEVQTVVWLKIQAHFQDRLASMRKRNDNPLSELETATLRGRIAEIKEILSLAEPPPVVIEND